MLQDGWSIVYMAPIQQTEAEENAKVFIMLWGDGLLLIVAIPTMYGVAAGEVDSEWLHNLSGQHMFVIWRGVVGF